MKIWKGRECQWHRQEKRIAAYIHKTKNESKFPHEIRLASSQQHSSSLTAQHFVRILHKASVIIGVTLWHYSLINLFPHGRNIL
jgi:hypothetical protein